MYKNCSHCGSVFEPKFANAKLCFSCWKKRETALEEYDEIKSENEWLRRRIAKLETRQGVETSLLKKLIRLCHPDKHGNSDTSNEVTVWLLKQRDQVTLGVTVTSRAAGANWR